MHPSSLMPYYPTYSLLDEFVTKNNYKVLNLYIDLKNCLQTVYMEHAVVNMIESTRRSQFVDTSMFSALLAFLNFHKTYSIKRNIHINFFIFFETGRSTYHLEIQKTYKQKRLLDDLYCLDKESKELFRDIGQKNLQLIEKAFNRVPYVKVIRLHQLEADFVPHYLIGRKLTTQPNTCHVIYSNDHDMHQTLIYDDVFIFRKVKQMKYIVSRNNAMTMELKRDTEIDISYHPLYLAIAGDEGDDVYGIGSIGPATFIKIFPQLNEMIGGDMNTLYDNVLHKRDIFDMSKYTNPNKYIDLILQAEKESNKISNNLKLVSFELISRMFESPINTEIQARRNAVKEIIESKLIANKNSLVESLTRLNVFFGDEFDTLYRGV